MRKLITYILLYFVSSSILASEGGREHIYIIDADECGSEIDPRISTGFVLQGRQGIITTLHGVVGCRDISAVSPSTGRLDNLSIHEVDIDRDLATLIGQDQTTSRQGRRMSESSTTSGSVTVLGHPQALIGVHEMGLEVPRPAIRPLREVLTPDIFDQLNTRGSPDPSISIIQINGDLQPGHSGGPIINANEDVIGVANGGIGGGIAWAIPLSDAEWRSVRNQENRQRLDQLRNNSSVLFWMRGQAQRVAAYPSRPSVWRYVDGRVTDVITSSVDDVVHVSTFKKIRTFNYDNQTQRISDVVDDFRTGHHITGVAISPDGRVAYAVESMPERVLKKIDLENNEILSVIPFQGKSMGCQPVFSPSGDFLLVATSNPNTNETEMWVHNTQSDEHHIVRFSLPALPCFPTVSTRSSKIYFGVGEMFDQIGVFEQRDFYNQSTEAISPSKVIPIDKPAAQRFVENKHNPILYVLQNEDVSSDLSVVDLQEERLIKSIPIGNKPFAMAITPQNSRWLYVTSRANNTISVIDTQNNTIIDIIELDSEPVEIAISARGDKVYVGHLMEEGITLIQ